MRIDSWVFNRETAQFLTFAVKNSSANSFDKIFLVFENVCKFDLKFCFEFKIGYKVVYAPKMQPNRNKASTTFKSIFIICVLFYLKHFLKLNHEKC